MILTNIKGSSGSQSISPMLSSASLAIRAKRFPSQYGELEQECQRVINSPSHSVKAGLSDLCQLEQSSGLKLSYERDCSTMKYF